MSKGSDNIRKSRPLSPHLSIYKPQISSVLSVGHRLSGIGLFFSLAIFCWWFIVWGFSKFDPCYLSMLDNRWVQVLLIFASYGFFYHLCTGIRHLVWDTGRNFSVSAINYSGWLALVASIALMIIYIMCM